MINFCCISHRKISTKLLLKGENNFSFNLEIIKRIEIEQ